MCKRAELHKLGTKTSRESVSNCVLLWLFLKLNSSDVCVGGFGLIWVSFSFNSSKINGTTLFRKSGSPILEIIKSRKVCESIVFFVSKGGVPFIYLFFFFIDHFFSKKKKKKKLRILLQGDWEVTFLYLLVQVLQPIYQITLMN